MYVVYLCIFLFDTGFGIDIQFQDSNASPLSLALLLHLCAGVSGVWVEGVILPLPW